MIPPNLKIYRAKRVNSTPLNNFEQLSLADRSQERPKVPLSKNELAVKMPASPFSWQGQFPGRQLVRSCPAPSLGLRCRAMSCG